MWSLILILSYLLVKTDHGFVEKSIYYDSDYLSPSLSHFNTQSYPLWTLTTDTKVLSSVITADHAQTLYYTSERTVLALIPSHISNTDSLFPLSTLLSHDLVRDRSDISMYKENIMPIDFENQTESLSELITKHVWIVVGVVNLLIAAVAVGFRLGRKSVKCKPKGSHRSTVSKDENSRLNIPVTVRSSEDSFKISSERESFADDTKHISKILSESSVSRTSYEQIEQKELISDDFKQSGEATLLYKTEEISPILFKPLKSITYPSSFSILDSKNKASDVSFLQSFEEMSSESASSLSSESSENIEESHEKSVVPYRINDRFFNNHRNDVIMTEETKNEYVKEKFTLQPLVGLEKETKIESEVRFERTDDPKNYKKIETHVITTTYKNTEEVEKYYDDIENCEKSVLAVQGTKDHETFEVNLEAASLRTPAKTEIQFNKSQFQLEFRENESSSDEQEESQEEDVIEFKRARESLDPDFKELFEVLDDGNYSKQFVVETLLGKGGCGAVYLAKHKLDMQKYAVKIVKMNIGVSETINTHKLFREVNTIKSLCSKYLVRYITCWAERDICQSSILDSSKELDESELSFLSSSYSENTFSQFSMSTKYSSEKFIKVNLHIQMEFCEGMNLKMYLDSIDRPIDRRENYSMMKKLLKGVKHIHDKHIIHRDLKPANIFIDRDNIKIGDFGLATEIIQNVPVESNSADSLRHSTRIGTALYVAPEQESSAEYDHKVDMFPLGLILFEMSYKFETGHEKIHIFRDLRKGILPDGFENIMPYESNIISRLLSLDPKDRPDAKELLQDSQFLEWGRDIDRH